MFFLQAGYAQRDTLHYFVDLKDAAKNIFNVKLVVKSPQTGVLDFKIAEWTPGYYQLLNFSDHIYDLEAFSENKKAEGVSKTDHNTWRIPVKKGVSVSVQYKVLAKDSFIARPFINEERAFIRPTGVFIFPALLMDWPAEVSLLNHSWKKIATGLDKHPHSLVASNVDELLDGPILIGNLDELKSFAVKGIPHYFIGRQLHDFNGDKLMEDVKKIVESATEMMGDIPYKHYTFISIGKGNGGIEQTNSTALAFNGELLNQPEGRQSLLNFLTHEYFHHFNIKRIRPVELGPFDYSKENRTNLLWVGEGLTVYFEDIILNRAGLKSRADMLNDWGHMMENYENNAGKDFQTLAESSYHTWEDGPFGKRGKTISFYEKGPLIGMLLDLKIRTNTANRSSLIDVMKILYRTYYQNQHRGFTEEEMKAVCEQVAQTSLDDIFAYIYHTGSIDYNKYFIPAGLQVVQSQDNGKFTYRVGPLESRTPLQEKIFNDLFRD